MWTAALQKMRHRGGVNLPSREEHHIYRLPPSAIATRKHEPVSEADVMWNLRSDGAGSDPTRLNENIRQFAAGVNPSVSIEYQNHGSGGTRTTALHQAQVGSAYKIEVVRPPLFPVETTNSISNPRTHQSISVETNPGLPWGNAGNTIAYDYDMGETSDAVRSAPSAGPRTVNATAYYKLETPSVMSARWAINENARQSYEMMSNPSRDIDVGGFVCREQTPYGVIIRPTHAAASSNPSLGAGEAGQGNTDMSAYAKKEVLLQNIRPNFSVVVYDPSNHNSTEVSANVREKNYIAVNAALGKPITLDRQDGTKIRLKNYTWTAVQTNMGTDTVILTTQDPEFHLERNLPLYATAAGLTMPTDTVERRNTDYDLEGKVAAFAQPSMDLSTWYNSENARAVQDATRLDKKVFTSSFDNQGSARPMTFARQFPQLRDTSTRQEAHYEHYDRLFG